MSQTVRLSQADNVVTAVTPLETGQDGAAQLIPRGHKMATEAIAAGAPVTKYAQVIGYAAEDIAPGQHVHTHNLDFRTVDTDYEFGTNLRPAASAATQDTFMGYRRASGRVGTRNYNTQLLEWLNSLSGVKGARGLHRCGMCCVT